MIQRARRRLILHRCPDRLATHDALEAEIGHQSRHCAACYGNAFTHHLSPDLAHPIDLEVLGEDPGDLRLQRHIPLRPRRELPRIGPLGGVVVVGRGGDRQNLADRLDPVDRAMIVDEGDHVFDRRSSSAIAK
jgi:hypothetical protein